MTEYCNGRMNGKNIEPSHKYETGVYLLFENLLYLENLDNLTLVIGETSEGSIHIVTSIYYKNHL